MKENIPDPPRQFPRIIKEGEQPVRFDSVDKKPFWETTTGKIIKVIGMFALKAFVKNQKGIKNTPNAQKVDEVFDKL